MLRSEKTIRGLMVATKKELKFEKYRDTAHCTSTPSAGSQGTASPPGGKGGATRPPVCSERRPTRAEPGEARGDHPAAETRRMERHVPTSPSRPLTHLTHHEGQRTCWRRTKTTGRNGATGREASPPGSVKARATRGSGAPSPRSEPGGPRRPTFLFRSMRSRGIFRCFFLSLSRIFSFSSSSASRTFLIEAAA